MILETFMLPISLLIIFMMIALARIETKNLDRTLNDLEANISRVADMINDTHAKMKVSENVRNSLRKIYN